MTQELMKYLKTFEEGSVIIKEGEQDKSFYCLVQGKVSIWKGAADNNENGQQVKLGEIDQKGAYFGEMSSFLDEPRTATVRAENAVKVLCFPGEMLITLMKQQSDLALKICQAMSLRLKDASHMSHQEALGKITVRTDAADQGLYAKESFQKLFMMLSAIQKQFQNPMLKLVIEFMSKNKLVHGGKQLVLSEDELNSFPVPLVPLIKKLYG